MHEENHNLNSEPRSGERHESPLDSGGVSNSPFGTICECGEGISQARARILRADGKPLTCKSCADASHVPYRADAATTRDGQILELVLHRTLYSNGVRLGGSNGLLSLAR